jgi:membrane-bound inhibitor of C-type lysozyme
MNLARIAGVAALAAALGGCYYDVRAANRQPMPWGSTVVVDCQGGTSMAIEFVDVPRAARVRFDGTTVTLPEVAAASDARFSDGRFILFVNDERALLEDTGRVLRGPCRPR